MHNPDDLIAIEAFLRSNSDSQRILDLDSLILRNDLAPIEHNQAISNFMQTAIQEAQNNEQQN